MNTTSFNTSDAGEMHFNYSPHRIETAGDGFRLEQSQAFEASQGGQFGSTILVPQQISEETMF